MRETFKLKTPHTLFPWTSQLEDAVGSHPGSCLQGGPSQRSEAGKSGDVSETTRDRGGTDPGFGGVLCSWSSGPAGLADEKAEGRGRPQTTGVFRLPSGARRPWLVGFGCVEEGRRWGRPGRFLLNCMPGRTPLRLAGLCSTHSCQCSVLSRSPSPPGTS